MDDTKSKQLITVIQKWLSENIHTSVPTGPMLGLGPLDDGGHRHHRLLLLHHLGRLDLPVFTRHFYFLSFLSSWIYIYIYVYISLNPRGILFSSETRAIPWSLHLDKTTKQLATAPLPPLFLPFRSSRLTSPPLLVSIWFRSMHSSLFGCFALNSQSTLDRSAIRNKNGFIAWKGGGFSKFQRHDSIRHLVHDMEIRRVSG